MSSKRIAWLAWALCGLTICIAVALFVYELLNPNHSSSVLKLAGNALSALVMPIVCAIVAAGMRSSTHERVKSNE